MTKFDTICETQHYDHRTTGKIERREIVGALTTLNWVYDNHDDATNVGRALRGLEAWTLATCQELQNAITTSPKVGRHGVAFATVRRTNSRWRYDGLTNKVEAYTDHSHVNALSWRPDKLFGAFAEIIEKADAGDFDCLVQTARGMDLRDAGDTKMSDRSPLILLALRERQALEEPGMGWRNHDDDVVVGHVQLVRNLTVEMDDTEADEGLGPNGQMLHDLIHPDDGDLGQDWSWFDEHLKAMTAQPIESIRHLPNPALMSMVHEMGNAQKKVEDRTKQMQNVSDALRDWSNPEWVKAHVEAQQNQLRERLANETDWLNESQENLDSENRMVATLEAAEAEKVSA